MVSLSMDVVFRRIVEEAYLSMHPVPVGPDPVGETQNVLGGVFSLLTSGVRASTGTARALAGKVDALPGWAVAGVGMCAGVVALKIYEKNKNRLSSSVNNLRLRFKRDLRVVQAGNAREVLESVRAGSTEVSLTSPKCQCQIGRVEGGNFIVYGNAIRFADHLIAPDHVLSMPEAAAKGSQGVVKLEDKDRIMLATDLVAIKLNERDFSTIGISICKIGTDAGAVHAQVVGPLGQGTTGVLKHDNTSFGRMLYEGTTLPGYSGAAYCVGTQVFGIHCRGGAVNGGYSASYAWAMLRSQLQQTPESSEDWLRSEFDRSQRIRWSTIGTQPDMVMVFVRGRYEEHSTNTMYSVFGENWSESPDILPRRRRDFDVELESATPAVSGERTGLSSGGSSTSANPQPAMEPSLQDFVRKYESLSRTSRKQVRTFLGSLRQVETTSGQARPAAPANSTV
nr:hypothetical protein [Leuven Sobemo-like virus 2]